jgi:uncharacterized RDD family membrane protein YckC
MAISENRICLFTLLMIITPEPKLGRRGMAMLIDYLIYYAFFFWALYTFGTPNEEGGYSLHGWRALSVIGVWIVYFPIVESFRGQTLGKVLMGLRVVTVSGNEVSFIETFKRHLLDCVDLASLGLTAVVVIKNSPKAQRIGDLWAKTMVIGGDTAYCVHCHEPLEISANEITRRKFQCPSCHTENVYTQGRWQVASPANADQGNASGVRL